MRGRSDGRYAGESRADESGGTATRGANGECLEGGRNCLRRSIGFVCRDSDELSFSDAYRALSLGTDDCEPQSFLSRWNTLRIER